MRLFSIRLREVQKGKKHRDDDDEDKKLKTGNAMIGHGVKVIPQDDGSDTDSETWDNNSETESEYDSGDKESDGEGDVDSEEEEEPDWCEDMDPSDIFIEDDTIYTKI